MGTGFNKAKTTLNPIMPFRVHMQKLDAILHTYKDNLNGCEIYVYRETKEGIKANSKPCIYCQILLKKFNIKSVYYTDNNMYKHIYI